MKFNAVALIGGSFDPIHNGHIAMGKAALQQLEVDKVLYIPTKQNPLKTHTTTSYKQRCDMIALALQDEEKMELYQNGAVYTIDLLTDLKKNNPNINYYFIIGADSVAQLSKWKEIDNIFKLATIYAFSRENEQVATDYPVQYLNFENHEESSTKVREGYFKYVDKKVYDYIFKNHLYLEEIVKKSVDEYRYIHTLSVVDTALKIAKAHNKDDKFLSDMYLAALFHDICKCWDKAKLKQWMELYFPEKLNTHPNVWHSYVGSKYIQKQFLITNKRIINAIYNHTILEEINDFNLVLKLADTIEPKRKNIDKEVEKLAYIDLEASYYLLQEKQKEMRKEK